MNQDSDQLIGNDPSNTTRSDLRGYDSVVSGAYRAIRTPNNHLICRTTATKSSR